MGLDVDQVLFLIGLIVNIVAIIFSVVSMVKSGKVIKELDKLRKQSIASKVVPKNS